MSLKEEAKKALDHLRSITGRDDLVDEVHANLSAAVAEANQAKEHVQQLVNTTEDQANIIKNLEAELAVGIIKLIVVRLFKKFGKR